MPKPFEDPENARFYKSGAEMPGYDNVPADPPPAPPTENHALSVYRGSSPEPEELRHSPVRIYSPSPSPMQGGRAHAGDWIVEFEPHLRPGIDPLMGWISSADPQTQVRLNFSSLEAAMAYCRKERLPFEVVPPEVRRRKPRSYADNFTPFDGNEPKPIYQH